MKKIIILLFSFFLSMLNVLASEIGEDVVISSQRAVIESIEYTLEQDDIAQAKQLVVARLIGGESDKELITLENILTGNPYYDIKLKTGSKVLLHVEDSMGEKTYSIEDIERSKVLLFLSFLFCGLLIYVGKRKGIYSLVAIAITCILIFNILSPLVLIGLNPILATILICLLSTAFTMYLVGGFNRKSTSATLGCTLSLIFAGLLSISTAKLACLTGFNSEHSMFLYNVHPELNFVSIAVSTMILATLGAVMDVAMSIASTINEIYTVDNTKSVKELFNCGMNVGRDIIGTMANTLILVYLGTSLPLLLLASNIDFQKFINLNQVVTEISSALIGSCAIVICVPITALVASKLVRKTMKNIDFSQLED